jgi:hypothetical protein
VTIHAPDYDPTAYEHALPPRVSSGPPQPRRHRTRGAHDGFIRSFERVLAAFGLACLAAFAAIMVMGVIDLL